MFPVFSCICSKQKERANIYIYSQMSCATKNAFGFHICAQNWPSSRKWNGRWCWSLLRSGLSGWSSPALSPLFCSCRQSWGSTRQKLPFPFFWFFSLMWLLQAGLQEAAFRNPKFASRQILQTPVCMEQASSIPSPLTKNMNFKILRLREMAVLNSSLISNYESL